MSWNNKEEIILNRK